MARVSRLAGAIVAATIVDGSEAYFLVGDTKAPCDWTAAGFIRPADRSAAVERYVRLVKAGGVTPDPTHLELAVEGEALARLLADRLLIARNGSVSERLWRLVTGEDEEDEARLGAIDARWLGEIPKAAWDIVRDAVLRCT